MDQEKERYIFVETFGCQMNDSDSQKIESLLSAHSYKPTREKEKADLIILNTCSIRHKAEQKVYSYLGTLKSFKERNPDLVIGVGGCVAQQQGEKLLKRVPHLDVVFGTHNINKLPQLVADVVEKKKRGSETAFYTDEADVFTNMIPKDLAGKTTGLVTVMLGCDNYCSYCIVPYVRGREISRPAADIIGEVDGLARKGIKEVTLIGQNVNSYGSGLDEGIDFPSLLRMVNDVQGIERIRFMTSHPKDMSASLISSFGSLSKLCEQVHLPVQSGSDRVLKGMNRRYTREEYLSKVGSIRDRLPEIAISSDIIVGFPGETDSDFDETMDLLEDVRYDSIFSFKYSPRPGTGAARLGEQVEEEIKDRRLSLLQEKQREISLEKNREYEGREVEVLVEGATEDASSGRTRTGKIVNFQGGSGEVGRMTTVRITRGGVNSLVGEIAE